MIKKNSTLKFILSVFFAILIIFIFIFFLKIIKDKNRNTSTAMMTLQEKIKTKEKMTMFFEKSEEIRALQNDVNDFFVDTKKIDTFVNYLESLGLDIGSKIIVKEIKVPEKLNDRIEFQLSITGNFDQVTKTVIILENIPYQIEVTRVYYNKEIDDNKDEKVKILEIPTWQVDLTFNILKLN